MNIHRYFKLLEFPMPKVACWPDPELNEWDMARFETALIEYIMPELEDEDNHLSALERCEAIKNRLLEQYRSESAELVRDELRR